MKRIENKVVNKMNRENEDPIQYIAHNFRCPVCLQAFPNVWDAIGHLSKFHPINHKQTELV